MTHYLTLSEAKRAINTLTVDATKLDSLLDVVSAESIALDGYCNRRFAPHHETRPFSARSIRGGGDVDGQVLHVYDLLSVETIVNGAGLSPLFSEYELFPLNGNWYTQVHLKPSAGLTWSDWTSDVNPETAIRITGLWGYGGRWINSGFTLNANITDSATQVALTGSGATVEEGMLLRVESEYLVALASQSGTTPFDVERAANGTVAAAHSSGVAVYRFEPDLRVKTLVRRLVQWRFEQFKSPQFGVMQVGDVAQPVRVDLLPHDVQKDINLLRRTPRIRGG